MPQKYYLDSCIWRDYFDNRTDNIRPLGEWAHRLLALIEAKNEIILVSDFLISELSDYLSKEELNKMFDAYKAVIKKIEFTKEQLDEARKMSNNRKVPLGDCLHAIMARDNEAVLVTRDNHFLMLLDVSVPQRPEELI